jgi:hypothetical protein
VQVQLDLRRHPRKAVQLRGTLGTLESYTKLSDMVITSVSVHGVGFVLAHPLHLQIGERYTARFRLDDAEQSRIHEPMVIRRLQGATVGAEFIPAEQYHHALDFYVYGAHLLPPPRHVPQRVRRLPGPSPHPPTKRSSPLPVPMVV